MNNTILAILHTLNILAFVTEIAVKSAVHIITFTIVVVLMTKEFVTVVYNNRREILEKIDNIRNSVGYHFVYANWRSGTRVVDLPSKSCIVVSVEKFHENFHSQSHAWDVISTGTIDGRYWCDRWWMFHCNVWCWLWWWRKRYINKVSMWCRM